MEERSIETNHEDDQYTLREEEELVEDEELDEPSLNSDFLSELNLIIVFLSIISVSSEDCEDCGNEEMVEKLREPEAHITRLHRTRREIQHVKGPGKQAKQRFQPMIKDTRHGRRV